MADNTWKGMDPDDVSGYLMDELASSDLFHTEDGHLLSEEALSDRLRNGNFDELAVFILNIRNAIEAINEG